MKFIYIFIVITTLIDAYEYKLIPSKRSYSPIDRLLAKSVADMHTIPQDPSYYAKQIKPISWSRQLEYDKEYNKRYFKPWSLKSLDEPYAELTWQFKFVDKKVIYSSKNHKISKSTIQRWKENSNFDKLNSVKAYAITIKHSNLRAFPTSTHAYRDPWKNTEGFPFDYFQHSEIHINVPLFISHYSKDKKWAFVEASHASGWIKMSDIAPVDSRFIKRFKSGKYMITTVDDMALYNGKKRVSLIKMSTIFPLTKDGKKIMVATKDVRGRAKIATFTPPPHKYIAKKPLRFNSYNVAKAVKEMYNEPYGWGGLYKTRDCSALTRDFFALFGIFLKRNSAKQAREGIHKNIARLPKQIKKQAIINNALPFRSMLYVPGHITLYLGSYKNEPIIFHNYWGIRLKDWSKYPLCRAIITTTEPGKELPNIREKSKLINTLQQIITF